MGALQTVVQISRVELLRFLRERSNIFFVFVLPLALVIFIGLQFGGAMGTQLGAVATDDAAATELIERLDAADGIEVVPIDDEDELRSLVSRGNLSGGVLIPDGYEDALRSGATVEIGFLGRPDATAQSLRTVVDAAVADQAAVSGAASLAAETTDQSVAELLDLAAQVRDGMAGVSVSTEAVGGDELTQEFGALGQFDLGASSQLFLFVFLTSLASSAALIQTRQYGVATRMLSTPTSTFSVLLGTGGGRLAIALFQAVYIVVISTVAFGVNWGDPLGATAVILLFAVGAAAAAMVVGSVFSTDSQAAGAGIGIGLGAAALGGSMVPIELYPETVAQVARITPHFWANEAMAELVRRDGTIVDILPQLAALGGFAVALVALGSWTLSRALVR